MSSLRTARGQAALAGLVVILMLSGLMELATWRTQSHQRNLRELEQMSVTATALEHARAQFYLEITALSGLAFSQDPSLAEMYHDAHAALGADLDQARAGMLAREQTDDLATLDDLMAQKAQFDETAALAVPLLLQMDSAQAIQMVGTYLPQLWDDVYTASAELDQLAASETEDLAANRAAAVRAADVTLWFLIGASAVVLVAIGSMAAILIVSVVRPLASLRASARAITSGDLKARAKVFGPEEVASLARDFNQMTDALSAKTEEYIATTNLTGDIMARLDKVGNWTFLNDAACLFYGKPREELLGTDSGVFVHPDDVELTTQSIRQMRANKEPVVGFENRQVTPMGARVVEWNGYPIFDEEDQYTGIQITGRDITERRQMEEALQKNEQLYRLITENTSDLIWTMDLSLKYTYMSPVVTRMRGYTVEEVMALSAAEAMTPASYEAARKSLAEQLALEGVEGVDPNRATRIELEMYCKDGSTIWTEMNMTWLRGPDGRPNGILGVTRNISERKRMEEEQARLHAELEMRAITDGLTSLYNHAHFYQRLAEEIDRSKRYDHGFAVVMMDVDNFKLFNDSCGHQAGDEMLRLVADAIRAGLRRSDVAFRYGGDEFAAILPHADSKKAQVVVNRINRRIAKSLKQVDGDTASRLSLSAGVACFPDDGSTADELVKVADAALYSAKWAARARDVAEEGYATDSPIVQAEVLSKIQTEMLSSSANSLTAALRELGVPDILAEMNMRTITALGSLAEIKDPYVRGHQERTSGWAATLAEEMGLPSDQIRATRFAGLLHDLGKAGISKSILNKPGKLTEKEFAKIKEHPPLGSMMIVSEVAALQKLVPIVRHHHERFDGTGYPDGLAGQEIPLEARILAVVDAFDAMTHERVYRKALTWDDAIAELERGAGTQFDPAVVQTFLALVKGQGEEPAAYTQATSETRQLAAVRTTKTK